MADFQLKVTAETQKAEKDLQRLDKTATEATKERRLRIDVGELNKNFKNVQSNIKEAANTIQNFYRVGKNIPGIGDRVKEFENLAKTTAHLAKNAPASAAALQENAKAGSILSASLETAGAAANRLIGTLAKAGFALFAVKEAVGVLQAAFGGFFNETIGREIRLRETILKTQTTLASTNKVFRDGKEITDPYQKIVALTGEVAKRIDSIRERSIALAGVTSNDVIEVFGIVASQVGQIGGGLKEAEDLAINFAAALGTFGIPLYQARQEIGSILRGDITTDSYLAKALGITNQDITKAKTKAGGVIKFLEERLAASVAGQRIAAQGFAGVVSNIKDLAELLSQRFGAGLLDPLLGGLTKIFDFLFKIREEVFAISSELGGGIGRLLSTNLAAITGGSALFGELGAGAEAFAKQLAEGVKRAFDSLQANANTFIAPLRNILEEVAKSIGVLSKGLVDLAQGFVSIKIENFKALVQIFSNLSEAVATFSAALSKVLQVYGSLLQVPFVQYLSQISAQFQLLERLGVMSAIKLGVAAATLISAWQPIVAFFQALVARIAALLAGLVIAVGAAFTRIGATIAAFAATLTATYPAAEAFKQQLLGLSGAFTTAGASADKAGASVARFGGATTAAARAASSAIIGFIKLNAILLAVQVAITVAIDAFGKYQQAQEEASRLQRAEQALTNLSTKYKDVGESADSATKSARDFDKALADAEYSRVIERLRAIGKEMNDLQYEAKVGIQTWGEFFKLFDVRRTLQRALGNNNDSIDAAQLLAEQIRLRDYQKRYEAEQDKKAIEDNINLEADKRVNLEKEIRDLRRQHEDEIFQQRQSLAQKEVEIFRAAGELRIYQMEQANKKLLEGQEGESRAALEALNNYLSVRERGELEIESAKQSLAVEVANMERSIMNYRLEMEKKIFDLRKRAGENDIASAQAREQLANQQLGGPVPTDEVGRQEKAFQFFVSKGLPTLSAAALAGGFSQESNLRSNAVNPTSKAEGIAQWLGGRKEAMIAYGARNNFNKQLEFAWQELQGSESGALSKLRDARTLNQALLAAAAYERFDGYQAIGAGTEWGERVGYTNAILNRGNRRGQAQQQITIGATPQLQGRSDIGDGRSEAEEFAAAVRSVTSAMERLRVLQKALTDARTREAFESIAKSVFEPVGLEEYQDRLAEVQLTYQAIAASSDEAFDPERAQIEVNTTVRRIAATRELAQIDEALNNSTLLSAEQKAKIMAELDNRHQAYLRSLQEEETMQKSIQAVQRGNEAILRLRGETADTYKNIELLKEQKRLEYAGVSPERIAAELEKLRIRQYLNEEQARLNKALDEQRVLLQQLQQQEVPKNEAERKKLQADLAAALARIKELEAQLGQLPKEGAKREKAADDRADAETKDPIADLIGRWKRELSDTRAVVASLAQTIQSELGAAMSNAVTGVLEGTTTVREAFANMFKNIAKAFLDMAMQMIAKALVMKALGILFPASGGTGAVQGGLLWDPAKLDFIPARASGGPVSARRPYIVGERGPELFTPDRSGTIIPNNALGGGGTSVVVNVDAKGTKVQGDDQQGSQLGRLIGDVVQQELIKQKRPGGLLA